METHDIRSIARHQHLRQVAMVELDDGRHQVRIRIDATDSCAASPAASGVAPFSASGLPPSALRTGASSVVIKSECLGVLRRAHPSRPGDPVVDRGERVAEGQPLALLQLGDAFTSVNSPCAGIVEGVLAEEGQRIDYGMPLFRLSTTGR